MTANYRAFLTSHKKATIPLILFFLLLGFLSVDYTFKSDAGILDVNNDINLKNIKLMPDDQDKIDQLSKQLTMPLDTALSILRDKNNDINLSIPVQGDTEGETH